MLKYEKLVLGEMETNCYLVWDETTKEAVVIDPADDGVGISEEIERLNLKLIVVLCTHGHFDHIMGALDLKLLYGVPIAISHLDLFLAKRSKETAEYFLKHKVNTINIVQTEIDLSKVKNISLGSNKLKVIKTPGHTPGSICFVDLDSNILFCGDTLFSGGSIGSADHDYSSMIELRKSIRKLLALDEKTVVLSGHGEADTIVNLSRLLSN